MPEAESRSEDRQAITEKLYLYARAIDARRFELFDRIFTEDAVIEYAVGGGTKLPQQEMRAWLAQNLEIFRATQHAISSPLIEFDGDGARSSCYLTATHEQVAVDGRRAVMIDNGVYFDQWRREGGEWRSYARRLERFVMHGDLILPDECKRYPEPRGPYAPED